MSSCSPDWGHVERFATDLDLKLDEDTGLLTEKLFLGLKPVWLISRGGTGRELTSQSPPVESFLDPPAVCFRPDRKDQFSKFHKYGLMFRCYDLVRQKVSPKGCGSSRDISDLASIFKLTNWCRVSKGVCQSFPFSNLIRSFMLEQM